MRNFHDIFVFIFNLLFIFVFFEINVFDIIIIVKNLLFDYNLMSFLQKFDDFIIHFFFNF